MNTYLFRVYRKDPASINGIAGVIENTLTRRQTSIRDMNGLQAALEDFIGTDDINHRGDAQTDMYGLGKAVVNG